MIGFAMCGSFCTARAALEQMRALVRDGNEVVPILSENLSTLDTRFGKASELVAEVEKICKRKAITNIVDAEPLGPKVPLEALIIAPCTGNSLAKIAAGITDTSVTMAAKAHARSLRPMVIALASNDALCVGLSNIATLMQKKSVYFVPLSQDSPEFKPNSLVCDYSLIPRTLEAALSGKQLQPLFLPAGSKKV